MGRTAKRQTKPPSYRRQKFNALLKRQIAEFLRQEAYPELTGLVTVTAVDTTPDLREAKVWVSVLGQDEEQALQVLKRHIFQIQGAVYRDATSRIVPKLFFYLDRSGAFSEHLGQVLRRTHHDD